MRNGAVILQNVKQTPKHRSEPSFPIINNIGHNILQKSIFLLVSQKERKKERHSSLEQHEQIN